MRRSTLLTAVTLLLAVTLLGACSSDGSSGTADLDGRTFVATDAEGEQLVPDVEVRFTFADGFVNIAAGCNAINGAYDLDDDTISWAEEPFSTLIGCPPELQAQDEWLTALLAEGATVTLEDGTLTLDGGETDVSLRLEEGAIDSDDRAAAELEGTIWLLTAIDGEDRPGGVEAPTLQIDLERLALVFTGCNNGSASVEITEDNLTFEPLVLTQMACEGETAEVEAAQVAVLDGEVAYELEESTLTLTKGERSLTYRSG